MQEKSHLTQKIFRGEVAKGLLRAGLQEKERKRQRQSTRGRESAVMPERI